MDAIDTPSYEKLQTIYNKYFTLGFLGSDINNKFALISLVCYLVYKLKPKNPDITHWSVLYKINSRGTYHVPEELLKSLAIICSDFGYGCIEFPTFGIPDKDIPAKIKELLEKHLPF